MRVLFLGKKTDNALSRSNAIARAGHEVSVISPLPRRPKVGSALFDAFHYRTGGLLLEKRITESVLRELDELEASGKKFDAVWVNNGRYVGPKLVQELQRRCGPVINFNQDDPYGWTQNSWKQYRRTLPFYDVVVVVREPNVEEAKSLGARRVIRELMVADEVIHSPRELTPEDWAKWGNDVVFVGTWRIERGPFLLELVERGVPLTIYGGRWDKSPEWEKLKPYCKGAALKNKDDYAKAIQCAKVSIGLLSKQNRDLHTTRSMEIPLLGGVLCAERTVEHEQLYIDGEEAIFWKDAEECARQCKRLLSDEDLRRSIAKRGQERCIRNGHLNSAMCDRVLKAAVGQALTTV